MPNVEQDNDQDAVSTISVERVQERPQEIIIPYSIRTGLFCFVFFLVSFIVIMVIRGVLDSLAVAFKFFANILLAGSSPSI
jgi:uncharacterized membrane protein